LVPVSVSVMVAVQVVEPLTGMDVGVQLTAVVVVLAVTVRVAGVLVALDECCASPG
jgi:hypothetical protein